MQDAAYTAPDRIFVKWATPTEEALSTVRLANALVERRIAMPEAIAIAAPNLAWAHNIMRAAASEGIAVVPCIAHAESPQATKALQELEAIHSEGLQGRSLIRRAGLEDIEEFAGGLLHIKGDESARDLAQLLREQLHNPTVAKASPAIPVMLVNELRSQPDYLFMVGCVNGLLPEAAALQADESALALNREIFNMALNASKVRTIVSYFVKAPKQLAEQVGVQISRYKTEDGQSLAMTVPSIFVTEKGSARPSTTGGQALLRMYGLN